MDTLNRTFVGVRLPLAQYQMLEEKVLGIKRKPGMDNIRWNGQSELLLNLCSLGELSPMTVISLKPILRQLGTGSSPLELEIKGFGGIPNLIQPRYIYAGIEGPDAARLPILANQIDLAMKSLTPHRDAKPFKAQIVLGRLKTESEQFRVALGRALKLAEQPFIANWRIEHIELLCSQASTSGIGYTVMDQAPLG
jgi:2'-5' RNA ligase